jgi:hypothetical protein
MTDTNESVAQRDRSPAFPVVNLKMAIERLIDFEAYYKRSAARPEKVGEAWKINTKAYADRIAAALRYFGLLEYQGTGKDRTIAVSEEGRKYLRAQQEETKQEVIKAAALRPKQIATFWDHWLNDRPVDAACIDDLVQNHGFSVAGARDFLKVYDATISYAGLTASDKIDPEAGGETPEEAELDGVKSPPKWPWETPQPQGKVILMAGERELTTGLLAKDASFRLIVNGKIGVKEIERLIQKLEIDKEILADQEGDATEETTSRERIVDRI